MVLHVRMVYAPDHHCTAVRGNAAGECGRSPISQESPCALPGLGLLAGPTATPVEFPPVEWRWSNESTAVCGRVGWPLELGPRWSNRHPAGLSATGRLNKFTAPFLTAYALMLYNDPP